MDTMFLRVTLREMLGRGQFVVTATIGTVAGTAIGACTKLFAPALAGYSSVMNPGNLEYVEWAVIGIALTFFFQFVRYRRRLADSMRLFLNLMEELIERGNLGAAQRKQLYHSLALRVSNEITLTGAPPSGDSLRRMIEEEKKAVEEVEG